MNDVRLLPKYKKKMRTTKNFSSQKNIKSGKTEDDMEQKLHCF